MVGAPTSTALQFQLKFSITVSACLARGLLKIPPGYLLHRHLTPKMSKMNLQSPSPFLRSLFLLQTASFGHWHNQPLVSHLAKPGRCSGPYTSLCLFAVIFRPWPSNLFISYERGWGMWRKDRNHFSSFFHVCCCRQLLLGLDRHIHCGLFSILISPY